MKFQSFDNNDNNNNIACKNLAYDSGFFFSLFVPFTFLELTEDQIKNQNGARLFSKSFLQQRPYFEKGYVFETDRLTLNEREYLKNVHEKVSVKMHTDIIIPYITIMPTVTIS